MICFSGKIRIPFAFSHPADYIQGTSINIFLTEIPIVFI